MGVKWISYRKKHELEAILGEFGLEQSGTVDEQHDRLIFFARDPENSEANLVRLSELERMFGNAPTGDIDALADSVRLDPASTNADRATGSQLGRGRTRVPGFFPATALLSATGGQNPDLPAAAQRAVQGGLRQHAPGIQVINRETRFPHPGRADPPGSGLRGDAQPVWRPRPSLSEPSTGTQVQLCDGGRPDATPCPASSPIGPLNQRIHQPERVHEPQRSLSRASQHPRRLPQQRTTGTLLGGVPESTRHLLPGLRTPRNPDYRMLSALSIVKRERASSDPESPGEPVQPTQPVGGTLYQHQGRIRAAITMEERGFVATLDTGATYSFISEDLARELGNANNMRDIRTQLKLADGTCRELTRALATNIYLGNKRAPTILLVMTGVLDGILLGMDFLCRIGATIQCGGQTLSLLPDDYTEPPWVQAQSNARRRKKETRSVHFEEPHSTPHEGPSTSRHSASTTDEGSAAEMPSVAAPSRPPLPNDPRRTRSRPPTPIPELRGRRRSTPWADSPSGSSSEEERPSDRQAHVHWVPAPDGWSTANGTLPAPLIRRIQQRLQGPRRRTLRYLEEEKGQRFRVQLNRDDHVRVFLHSTRN
ncbi:uncharacterized protein [Drosophila kikkawai]|uniref:Uncharacterized protein n=1 Tax=Drosophila kikkawai TaxID=30033 RepID=A0A6P4J1C7_DROKI|nr:uncharacterized protein LOC108083760 [Drosophila kikkawai]